MLVTYLMLEQYHAGIFLFQTFLSAHICLDNTWVVGAKHCEQEIDAGLGGIEVT